MKKRWDETLEHHEDYWLRIGAAAFMNGARTRGITLANTDDSYTVRL